MFWRVTSRAMLYHREKKCDTTLLSHTSPLLTRINFPLCCRCSVVPVPYRKFSWVYFSGLKRNKYDKIPKKYRDVIRKTASRVWRAVTRGGSQIWSKLSVIWFGCEKSKCFGFSKSCFVLLFEQHCLFWFDEPIRSTYDAFDKRRPILWKTT